MRCRFNLGEGIEKATADLAADVEEQTKAMQVIDWWRLAGALAAGACRRRRPLLFSLLIVAGAWMGPCHFLGCYSLKRACPATIAALLCERPSDRCCPLNRTPSLHRSPLAHSCPSPHPVPSLLPPCPNQSITPPCPALPPSHPPTRPPTHPPSPQAKAAEKKAEEAAKPAAEEPKAEAKPAVAISAAVVKELREKTGAGMMDCKKALAGGWW